jgi:hypothetical protein
MYVKSDATQCGFDVIYTSEEAVRLSALKDVKE